MKMECAKLTEEIRRNLSYMAEYADDRQVKKYIEKTVMNHEATIDLTTEELQKVVMRVFYSIRRDTGILTPYIEDDEVNEVMVNGKDDVFIEKNGSIERVDAKFESTRELEEVIRRIVSGVNKEINELHPIVDARLKDGSRVNAVYKNIALNGPILTIRKFPKSVHTIDDLIMFGTITRECGEYLGKLVKNGYNCFVSGGT